MVKIIFFIIVLLGIVAAKELTNEELHSFPKLFHLDDYDRCLAQRDGVYCLGTFELTARQPHPIHELIKVHQNHLSGYTFDRTLLHRGYCVSERCRSTPLRSERNAALHSERNATLRFERCAAKYARYSLTPRLLRMHYCTTHREHQAKAIRAPNGSQRAFLYVVYGILLLNAAGTLYHCFSGHSNKNNLLIAWSLPSNWARFTKIERTGLFAALAPLQGTRLIVQWIVIFAHCIIAQNMVYAQNPEYLEYMKFSFIGSLVKNGGELIQVFIFISCFLTGYNLLSAFGKTEVTSKMVLKLILKRLIRILPVYLLVLGYVITWFPNAGDGPVWSTVADKESEKCQRKFWTHLLFINNLVEPSETCMLQTWAIAVDMQLYIFSTLLTLLLMRLKVRAVPILAGLFVTSGVLTVALAYFLRLDPLSKIISPENLRKLLRDTPSYHLVHTSPWINLPACLLGLLIAFLFFEKANKKVKIDIPEPNDSNGNDGQTQNVMSCNGNNENGLGRNRESQNVVGDDVQTLNEMGSNGHTQNGVGDNGRTKNEEGANNGFTNGEAHKNSKLTKKEMPALIQNHFLQNAPAYVIPGLVIWTMLAATIERVESRVLTAIFIGMEHSVFSLVFAVSMIQVLTKDSFMRRLLAWPGWSAMGRLVFSVTILHWCVNLFIVVNRPVFRTSMLYISVDWLATIFYSNLLALPMCLLVELPAQKFLELLLFGPSTTARF